MKSMLAVPRIFGRAPEKSAEEIAAEEAAAAAAAAEAEENAKKEKTPPVQTQEVQLDPAKLAEEKANLLREVMEKKTKLKDAEKAAADAAAALAAYEGIDPAKVKELLKKEQDAEKAAAEAKGDFDRVKAMMAEEHGKEVTTLKTQLDDLRAQLAQRDETIGALTVGNDFSGSTFIRESLTLTPSKARALYGSHFEIQDGRTVAYDKPAGNAKRTMLVNAQGDPLPFDEAFKKIIEADPDKDTLLKVKVVPGGSSRSAQTDKPGGGKGDEAPELFGRTRIAASLASLKPSRPGQ